MINKLRRWVLIVISFCITVTSHAAHYNNLTSPVAALAESLPLHFPAQYYDGETSLHYNWNRYYDPKLGRYLQADPIRLGGGVNMYAYVGNNPMNAVDPEGLETPSISLGRNPFEAAPFSWHTDVGLPTLASLGVLGAFFPELSPLITIAMAPTADTVVELLPVTSSRLSPALAPTACSCSGQYLGKGGVMEQVLLNDQGVVTKYLRPEYNNEIYIRDLETVTNFLAEYVHEVKPITYIGNGKFTQEFVEGVPFDKLRPGLEQTALLERKRVLKMAQICERHFGQELELHHPVAIDNLLQNFRFDPHTGKITGWFDPVFLIKRY